MAAIEQLASSDSSSSCGGMGLWDILTIVFATIFILIIIVTCWVEQAIKHGSTASTSISSGPGSFSSVFTISYGSHPGPLLRALTDVEPEIIYTHWSFKEFSAFDE
ncbi:hypothetical protein CRG98_044405 [Punica granatum]|uniref:Uncharacterized protein n=1 Tax=Punica granatum TaxID=22663 RepID=A0A2I0HU58_PUNGR|nr:hypothetical protein CRG98_044405 [Punica granatum]